MSLRDDLIHIIDNKAMPSAYALTVIEFKDLSEKELATDTVQYEKYCN